ncbi:hypothetical protein OHA71_23620 [Streptomyces sp. NBC_00444]|uniref:hypothetical protein n=1 Tax=Streptomyces sp. NBC_00444 TaxID=2975744 RepID=UPI002E24EE6C
MTTYAQDTPPRVPAEDRSTGTAWRAPKLRPDPPELPPRYRPCTREEQAEHMAALLEGIAGYTVGRPGRSA